MQTGVREGFRVGYQSRSPAPHNLCEYDDSPEYFAVHATVSTAVTAD